MNVPRSFNFLRFFPYPLIKTYIDFMLNQEEYFSDSVRHAVPRPLSFLKSTSSQTSSLVLIFSKKVGFSLTKVGKVTDSLQYSYKLVFTLLVIQCVSF